MYILYKSAIHGYHSPETTQTVPLPAISAIKQMPRAPHRSRRIESELQRVLSDLLRREVKDPRVGNLTLTAVQVAPDLGHAKIFYTVFGKQQDPDEVQAGLAGAAKFLR